MKTELAIRLLSDLMGWDNVRVTRELSWLRLMVEYKYDHYEGFNPGSRFFVNLLHWLGQFDDHSKRQVAYDFVRNHLLFVSQREMHHLVSLSRPILEREMRRAVAKELGVPVFKTWNEAGAERRLRLMRLRTLYVGLSDGAKIDVFRRDNEGVISNEQVVAAPELSGEKWIGLGKELAKRLSDDFSREESRFERICLIDDFSASGSTLIRKTTEESAWAGKVPRFCKENKNRIGELVLPMCTIHVHHYLVSQHAKERIWRELICYAEMAKDFVFHYSFSYALPTSIVVSDSSNSDLVSLLKTCYDHNIETPHLGSDVWYGYKQCGLPVVLQHNTPNNSVALLWASSKSGSEGKHIMRPLFARKQRHIA